MLAVVFAAACADFTEDSELPDSEVSRYITFENFNVETKVTNDNITDQVFAIWIFDADHKDKDTPLFHGRLQYDDTETVKRWRLHNGTSYVDVEWGTGKHVFLAHTYWTNPALMDLFYSNASGTFCLPQNLSFLNYDEYTKDILYASAQTAEVDYKPVKLEFKHLFPSLKFVVHNNTGVSKTITDFEVRKFKTVCIGTPTANFQGTFMNLAPLQAFSEKYYYRDPDTDTEVDENAGVSLAPNEARVMFGSPVIVFPQEWNANENDATYYTPKVSFKVDGVSNEFNFYSDLGGLMSWDAGKQYTYNIKLNPLEPTVTIDHVKDANGVLTHSAVKLNLEKNAAQLASIKDLIVRVSKGGVTYKEQTFATVSPNEIIVTEGDYFYLPQGDDYEISVVYKFGNNDHANEVKVSGVSSPAPTYSLTLDVSATSSSCTIDKAVVGISDDVLSEVPLTGSLVLKGYSSESKAIESAASEFVSKWTLSSTPSNGYYSVDVTGLLFDGAAPESVKYKPSGCTVSAEGGIKPMEPKVGDYYYMDGSFSTELDVDKTVAGVVFFVGDPTADDPILKRDYPGCTHGLVVGYQNFTNFNGALSAASDWTQLPIEEGYADTQGIYSPMGTGGTKLSPAWLKTGYSNTYVLRNSQPSANAIQVCDGFAHAKGSASEWYMPSIAEFDVMYKNLKAVNDALKAYYDHCLSISYATYYNYSFILEGYCWTVTEDAAGSNYAAVFKFDDGGFNSPNKATSYQIRPIFAF